MVEREESKWGVKLQLQPLSDRPEMMLVAEIAQPNVRDGFRNLACSSHPRVGSWSSGALLSQSIKFGRYVYRRASLLQFAKPFAHCHP